MTENELAEKNAQFAKGVMELAFRMGYVTRDDEIVRCKDCKHYNGLLYTLCPESGMNVIDDEEDYCSRAERKEE